MLAGARWYSPHLKRWVSRDPTGYEGGTNLYSYVNLDPVGFADPTGLDAEAMTYGIRAFGGGGAVRGAVAGIGAGFSAPAVAVGVGASIGIGSIYCWFNPDDCLAAWEGYCDANPIDPNILSAGHNTGIRPSTSDKHDKGDARRKRDKGGEKGDTRRRPNRKPPQNWKGPWPPKIN